MMDTFKIRRFRGYIKGCLAVTLVFLLWLCSGRTAVNAAGQDFAMEAELLPGGDGSTYDIRVTVQNSGADWEGTVRLMMEDRYYSLGAYDTELSLPGGSRKQFTVRIPVDSMGDRRCSLHIILLDKRGEQIADREYARFLSSKADALYMGILSDDYPVLTFLDMGGRELYYANDSYPVKLVELNQDNLADHLASLNFLVIDHYSTEILTDEQMEDLRRWNEDGGVLIVGTGAYAEDTLGGFDTDYIGVESLVVYPPKEDGSSEGNNGTGGFTGNQASTQQYGIDRFVDADRLAMAVLHAAQPDCRDAHTSGGYVRPLGNGVVSVLPFALSEMGALDADAFFDQDRTYYVSVMLDEFIGYTRTSYIMNGFYYDIRYYRERLFGLIDNSSIDLNFSILKVIVLLYVVIVGPVLYLILKLVKKRELYWAAVPLFSLVGIVLVYMAGRGFEVKDTKVYSVTVEGLAGTGEKRAYMLCYDAGHSEWQLKLSGDYTYVGPLDAGYHYDSEYYHHIRRAGNEIFFGINPEAPFENCNFYAGGAAAGQQGSVELKDLENHVQSLAGTVVNGTGSSFSSFAIIMYDVMYVYGGLPAGESRELADLPLIYTGLPIYESYDYIGQLRSFYSWDRYEEEIDALAALGIGISGVAQEAVEADVFFMGVTEDYDNVVDDACSEVSYGCLYTVW